MRGVDERIVRWNDGTTERRNRKRERTDERGVAVAITRANAKFPTTPEGLHAALENTFRRGDLDGFLALHEPDGRAVHGLAAIREAVAPMVAMRPHLTSTVIGKVEGDGLALTHARWELEATAPDGTSFEYRGRGTIVSRRHPDGTWRIAIDNPMTPE
jgi:ketosteroid isomerase-like protein